MTYMASMPSGVSEGLSDTEESTGPTGAQQVERLPDPVAEDLVQLFKLLADKTRLRILCLLLQREELNVRTLCEMLGQSQPAVSHHLALLRVAGLIECRRDGKHNFYRVLPKKFEETMGLVLRAASGDGSAVRFEDYELRYRPAHGGSSAAGP